MKNASVDGKLIYLLIKNVKGYFHRLFDIWSRRDDNGFVNSISFTFKTFIFAFVLSISMKTSTLLSWGSMQHETEREFRLAFNFCDILCRLFRLKSLVIS